MTAQTVAHDFPVDVYRAGRRGSGHVRLTYDPARPHEVTMSGDVESPWVFAIDLFAEDAYVIGDVRTSWALVSVRLHLNNGEESAEVCFNRTKVERFLAAVATVRPTSTDALVDAALEDLLRSAP